MADSVLYDVTDGLATITLNRPDAMNALDIELKVALREAVRTAADDGDVRAVLLTGNGRAFCVGQDLKEHTALLARDAETGDRSTMTTVREHYNPVVAALAGMPKPVVAGVNGVAAGAGLGFALAADFRVVSDAASFTTAFAAVGLTADSGVSWTLPRVVGPGRAADLLFFPRTVSASEAYELGIANRLVAPEALLNEARSVARALADGPTLAYAAIKESLAHAASHSLVETLAKEDELQTRAGGSDDHRDAVAAFVAKQKPVFRGR
ncbi:enoyl-CoA hydratase/isomerase family protein [Streptomyces sp. NPDC058953]|uniref:enoyl-CoA hydratase/isomerase family protein n=1 Tax=unclassified Streptomyces TaxID=2593676 RepID=UPI0036C09D44